MLREPADFFLVATLRHAATRLSADTPRAMMIRFQLPRAFFFVIIWSLPLHHCSRRRRAATLPPAIYATPPRHADTPDARRRLPRRRLCFHYCYDDVYALLKMPFA